MAHALPPPSGFTAPEAPDTSPSAPSAVRLVYKSKVLSHKPAETLGSFGITPSEKPKPTLQLVVVRDGAAPKVEPPKPKPAQETQKGSWRNRRSSG